MRRMMRSKCAKESGKTASSSASNGHSNELPLKTRKSNKIKKMAQRSKKVRTSRQKRKRKGINRQKTSMTNCSTGVMDATKSNPS